jgi:hypothetical protein
MPYLFRLELFNHLKPEVAYWTPGLDLRRKVRFCEPEERGRRVWLTTRGVLVEGIERDCIEGGGGSLVRYVSEKVKRWKVDSCYDRRKESEQFPHAHPPKWRTRHAVVAVYVTGYWRVLQCSINC